jgi:hypothetical protein
MWGVSLLGVPMVVVGLDLLWDRRIVKLLSDLLFQPSDPQLPEPRETVWAVALMIVGLILVLWGLKELISPARVVVADSEGLHLKLNGPFRSAFTLPWAMVEDVGSGTVDDEGDLLPVLWVRSTEPGLFPLDPWGARPIDDRTLAILAADWEVGHVAAAAGVSQKALEAPIPEEREAAPVTADETGLGEATPDVE